MGTHAAVIYVPVSGAVHGIHVHYDGYPERPCGAGGRLLDNYNTPELARALVSLGNLYAIGPILGEIHTYEERNAHKQCYSYYRDGGDITEAPIQGSSWLSVSRRLPDHIYTYVFFETDGKWFIDAQLDEETGNEGNPHAPLVDLAQYMERPLHEGDPT